MPGGSGSDLRALSLTLPEGTGWAGAGRPFMEARLGSDLVEHPTGGAGRCASPSYGFACSRRSAAMISHDGEGKMAMKYGIHLPHAGDQATPALIRRHAERAEDLGLEDVWVSEHIIVPRDKFPRSPLFFDPVLSLTWAAAVTKRVKLGTTVLVLPMRHPLPLAKELATLHNFSEGRLILGAGSGWLKEEFAALGVPFEERGRRLDEGIAMMRAVWSEDPGDVQKPLYPSCNRGVDDDPDADHPDPAVVRRQRRASVEADDPDRRWMARQRAEPRSGCADRETAARGAAGGRLHDLHAGAVGWDRSWRITDAGQ